MKTKAMTMLMMMMTKSHLDISKWHDNCVDSNDVNDDDDDDNNDDDDDD